MKREIVQATPVNPDSRNTHWCYLLGLLWLSGQHWLNKVPSLWDTAKGVPLYTDSAGVGTLKDVVLGLVVQWRTSHGHGYGHSPVVGKGFIDLAEDAWLTGTAMGQSANVREDV